VDVIEHERLSKLTKIKIKEQRYWSCFTFHSHRRVFNNEHNSYGHTKKWEL